LFAGAFSQSVIPCDREEDGAEDCPAPRCAPKMSWLVTGGLHFDRASRVRTSGGGGLQAISTAVANLASTVTQGNSQMASIIINNGTTDISTTVPVTTTFVVEGGPRIL
jgi:hypothetical protein